MNIDWSNAPEGYPIWVESHFKNDPHDWHKRVDGAYEDRNGAKWFDWQAESKECTVHLRPQWTGEGLPPAETVVELRTVSPQTDWAKAKIKFASRNVVVWDWDGEPAVNGLCTAYAHAIEMRPVRTAEQIAAEERERAAKDLYETIRNGKEWAVAHELARQGVYRAIDAGYRKQVKA